MSERWLPVVGCPGYDVSDAGRVRSWWIAAGPASRIDRSTFKILKQTPCAGHGGDSRYLSVALRGDRGKVTRFVKTYREIT